MRSEQKLVLLTTLLFFLGAVAITMILPANKQMSERGGDFTPTLGGGPSTGSGFADKDDLSNEAYACFRMARFDIALRQYDQAAMHVRAVSLEAEREMVAVLVMDELLAHDCMRVTYADDEEAESEEARCRSNSMDLLMSLSQSLSDPALRAAYLIRLAEEQFAADNRLSPDDSRSWENLRAASEVQLQNMQSDSTWWTFDYRYLFTAVLTGCGFLVSLILKEVVGEYSKTIVSRHMKDASTSDESTIAKATEPKPEGAGKLT